MTKTKQYFYSISLVIGTLLSGCANNTANPSEHFIQRQLHATTLEANRQYADALIQLKIAKTLKPTHEGVNKEIQRMTQLITQKTSALTTQVKNTPVTNTTAIKNLCLKILALEPDNAFAKQKLIDIEFKIGLTSAKQKSAKMNESTGLSQQQQAIEQSDYKQQSHTLELQYNYPALLQLSNDYLQKEPQNSLAQQHKFKALMQIAQTYQKNENNEQAIPYLEQAAKLQVDSKLEGEITVLKQQLSQNYFQQASRVLKTDIEQAVQWLQTSVAFDADNLKAYKLLLQAQRIQQNLRIINGTN